MSEAFNPLNVEFNKSGVGLLPRTQFEAPAGGLHKREGVSSRERIVKAQALARNSKMEGGYASDALYGAEPQQIKGSTAKAPPIETIWQVIGALADLFQPQAIGAEASFGLANQINGQLATQLEQLNVLETKLNMIKENIAKEQGQFEWMHWAMPFMNLAMAVIMGGMIGGPVGAIAALGVGTVTLLLSDQLQISGHPLISISVTGPKGKKEDVSVFSYLADQAAKKFQEVFNLHFSPKDMEIFEGAFKLSLGVALGAVAGVGVGLWTKLASGVATEIEENVAEGAEAEGVPNGPSSPEFADEELEELTSTEKQMQRLEDKGNIGKIATVGAKLKTRSLLTFINVANTFDTNMTTTNIATGKEGGAWFQLLDGAGVDDAEYYATGINGVAMMMQMVGGFKLGAPSMQEGSFVMKCFSFGMKNTAQLTCLTDNILQAIQAVIQFKMGNLYTELAPVQQKSDLAEGDVQEIEMVQKAAAAIGPLYIEATNDIMTAASRMIKTMSETVDNGLFA